MAGYRDTITSFENRSIIVWAIGLVVVLGLFLYFVNTGWPGAPNACTAETPHACYCEAFELEDVESGAAGVRQSVNTWFNLYALLTSFIVAFFIQADRKTLGDTDVTNEIRSNSFIPDLYVFAVQFLGTGSMWFHGSLTEWGGVVDGFSMYVFVAFLVFYTVHRNWPSTGLFWGGYAATVVLFTYLHTLLPAVVNILILVGAYLVVEVLVWVRKKTILQGDAESRTLWLFAIGCIGAATFFWWASQTGNFLCDPNSFFQPHGLLWHPLAGITAVLMYFYWRREKI